MSGKLSLKICRNSWSIGRSKFSNRKLFLLFSSERKIICCIFNTYLIIITPVDLLLAGQNYSQSGKTFLSDFIIVFLGLFLIVELNINTKFLPHPKLKSLKLYENMLQAEKVPASRRETQKKVLSIKTLHNHFYHFQFLVSSHTQHPFPEKKHHICSAVVAANSSRSRKKNY